MPFTPAHVAAVLPAAGPLRRQSPVVLTALVVGSMAPDLPYYLPIPLSREQTHSLADAFTWTALVALAIVALWTWAVAPVARDLAGPWLRARLDPPDRPTLRALPAVYLAAVVGIITHVLWDGFTHPDGWFVQRIPWLQQSLGPWTVNDDLQLLSSVVGCAVVAAYLVMTLVHRPPVLAPPPLVPWRRTALAVVGLAFVAGAVVGWVGSPDHGIHHDLVKYVTTRALSGAVAAALVVCAVWWAQTWFGGSPERQRRDSQSSTSPR